MCDLRQGVYACIGSPRAVELEGLDPGDLTNRAIDLPLDRAGVSLNLPSAVTGAGVLDGQFQTHAAEES
jgi:hypothetical protein